jgi:hypothetical protein
MTAYTKVAPVSNTPITKAQGDQFDTQYDCAQQEFESGGWEVKKDLKPEADGTRSLGAGDKQFKTIHALRVKESGVHFRDDFLGALLDKYVWTTDFTDTINLNTYPGKANGVALIGETATHRGDVLRQGLRFMWSHGQNMELMALFKAVKQTKQGIILGLVFDGTHFIWFQCDNDVGVGTWWCKMNNGSASSYDTGIACDTNQHVFEIICSSGHVKFYIDGTEVHDFTTNIPTEFMEPVLSCISTEVATNTLGELDLVDIYQDR